MSTPRIPFPTPEAMNPEQRKVYDRIVNGRRGTLVGPLRAALHNADLADRWQALGQVLRYDTCLPSRLNELAILIVARHWTSELEWTIHAGEARIAGLDESVIQAIRHRSPPRFKSHEEIEIYDYCRELLICGHVSDAAYSAVLERWGTLGVVELTALAGYYSMVAFTLNAHRIPLPAHTMPELCDDRQDVAPVPPGATCLAAD
jgi:4-carboxymuconolactone decarboxylase